MRWIAHVDMDSFYVSVERLQNKELLNRPVVVGGLGPRAVVASSSYEARKYGVRSAMPMSQARRLCPGLVVVEPHFSLYSDLSHKIFSALEKAAPVVEQVSVDEAYLDLTGCERLYESRESSGRHIKNIVKEISGLTSSVGMGTNKLIAKIASDSCKPDGLLVVEDGEESRFLAPLSIRKIPGIGQKTALLYERLGVVRCADLAGKSPTWLHDHLGDFAVEHRQAAMGLDLRPVCADSERKSLGAEETFETDIDDLEKLSSCLRSMSDGVATEMRGENLKCRTIQIKMRYADFTTLTRAKTLDEPTALSREIAETAIYLLRKFKISGVPLRLLGISTRNFVSQSQPMQRQLAFFEDPVKREKEEKIERLKDELKRRFGPSVLGHSEK